ncbi:MAG: hypothetical protein SWJ54_04265 [Cyanobacteriota bacterium]|nr:hypothetical protein [Cyanobacteriota bacterium]
MKLHQYWTLSQITSGQSQTGYRDRTFSSIQKRFQAWFPELSKTTQLSEQQDREIQAALHYHFLHQHSDSSKWSDKAIAGLSLRCYVSHPIVSACRKLAQQFGEKYGFSYVDLLRDVLTDDGEPIILSEDNDQLILKQGKLQPSPYSYFSVDILRTFNPEKSGLWKWAYLLTRRHRELNQTLWIEYGLSLATPWARLNDIRNPQWRSLSANDRTIVEVFHQVYRRDRREQGARGKCPDPSESQLQEMRDRLRSQGIGFDSSAQLLEQLKMIAQLILEPIVELPEPSPDDQKLTSELCEVLDEERDRAILDAIEQVLSQRLEKLRKSAWYADFAIHFLPSLRLIYYENCSQSEVAKRFGMTDQSKVSRFLRLSKMIDKIREIVMDQLLQVLLKKAGIDPTQGVDNLQTFDSIIKLLSDYLDETVFTEAIAEIFAGKHRNINSLFAQKMCQYLNQSL